MKYLLCFLLISCNVFSSSREGGDKNHTEDYLTNGWICDTLAQRNWGTEVYNCEDVLTGRKVEKIINPSNIFIIKEVK